MGGLGNPLPRRDQPYRGLNPVVQGLWDRGSRLLCTINMGYLPPVNSSQFKLVTLNIYY